MITDSKDRVLAARTRFVLIRCPLAMRIWGFCLLFALGACDSALGVQELPHGAFSYASATCQSCSESQCAPELTRCVNDPACRSLYSCLAGCSVNDVRCRRKCEDGQANDLPRAYLELDGCRRMACLDDCYGTGDFAPWYGSECNACLHEKCETTMRGCVGVPSNVPADQQPGTCDRYLACMLPSPHLDPSVRPACSGNRILDFMYNTWSCGSRCAGQCPFGNDWSCVDHYSWPAERSATTVDVGVTLADILSNEAVAGTLVEACSGCTDPCVPEGTSHASDANGLALVTGITLATEGFRGCFETKKTGSFPANLLFPAYSITFSERDMRFDLVSDAALKLGYKSAKLGAPDPSLATILATPFDCWGSLAPHVTFTTSGQDPAPPVAYFSSSTTSPLPDPSLHETVGPSYAAAIGNVQPGRPLTIIATVDGKQVAHATVQVPAGSVARVYLYPDAVP